MQKTEDSESPNNRPMAIQTKKERAIRPTTVVLVAVVVAVASFIVGTRADSFIASLRGGQNTALPEYLDLSSVQDVYRELRNRYDGKLDAQQLVEGAKKGLVTAAGDPYTVYFTDQEAKEFSDDLEGKFSGIGAEIGKKDSNLIIVSTIDASPAQKAGLQTNDILAEVNGQDVTGWSIDKAVSQIRGDKGTTVKLTVLRDQEVKEFSIVRDNIVNPSVQSEIIDGNIGYMRISRFADDTESLSKRAAEDFAHRGVKGVILDLRGNGGGYIIAAQSVASLWLPPGEEIVQERVGERVQETLRASGGATLQGIKTVVLIDGGSASASEIVAGALSDHGVAQLVGTKTFGKGSVQQLFEIPSGGQLKATVAKWYTPSGKNIDKGGINPNIEVSPTEADIAASNDIQKAKALELLKN